MGRAPGPEPRRGRIVITSKLVTPEELGEDLARQVWESFADFMERSPLPVAAGTMGGGVILEELLIASLWIHTQVSRQSFAGREEPDRIKAVLDAMHRAVFEDLEAHGLARERLPLFEQQVSARYAEYYAAIEKGSEMICEVVARRVLESDEPGTPFVLALAEAAVAVANPLRDYLDELELDG